MTLTNHFTCDACGPVAVVTQVPDGTTAAQVAADLDAVLFESTVAHELTSHLDGIAS